MHLTRSTCMRRAAALLPLLLSVLATAMLAQDLSISGTIKDQAGKLIPNANVVVKNEATGFSRSTTSNGEGHFAVHGLPEGPYTIEASAPGFATTTHTGYRVGVAGGQELAI